MKMFFLTSAYDQIFLKNREKLHFDRCIFGTYFLIGFLEVAEFRKTMKYLDRSFPSIFQKNINSLTSKRKTPIIILGYEPQNSSKKFEIKVSNCSLKMKIHF